MQLRLRIVLSASSAIRALECEGRVACDLAKSLEDLVHLILHLENFLLKFAVVQFDSLELQLKVTILRYVTNF